MLTLAVCGINDAHAHQGLKEPVYPPYCWVQPANQELWYPCATEEAKAANCLSLMETAMKAVDSTITSQEPVTTQALKVWDRTKNECWSDLKDNQPQHYH